MEELGKQIDQVSNQLTELRRQIWLQYTGFSWQWWLLLGMTIAVTILFIIMVDRTKLLQVFVFYGVIYIMNRNLDDIATALDWYDYRIQLEPIIPTLLAANVFFVPLPITLIYQTFTKWKSYLIATVLFSAGAAYIALPLMKLADMYMTKAWNSHWSLFSLVAMSVLAKLITDKFAAIHYGNPAQKRSVIFVRKLFSGKEKAR